MKSLHNFIVILSLLIILKIMLKLIENYKFFSYLEEISSAIAPSE
jgi:hypothetical protein